MNGVVTIARENKNFRKTKLLQKMKQSMEEKITEIVADLCIQSNCGVREDVLEALLKIRKEEKESLAKKTLSKIIENIEIAQKERIPTCQDTGITEVFLEIGKKVKVEGNILKEAINKGVINGYRKGYLRKSIVDDPLFLRKNTGTNTPALIHFYFSPSLKEKIKITVFPKGFGSENMSRAVMLSPGGGKKGVKKFVLNAVKKAGANPCPPIIVGIGIGGTMQICTELAKKALLRSINSKNAHPQYAKLEEELFNEINKLGIGPQGFGGIHTCLGVNVEYFPTHIAGLPVGVNISCYALRQASRMIQVKDYEDYGNR